MKLEEFIDRFDALKNKGFVKSLRRGPTGIGKTLETYLGIDENNLYLPDLGEIELKAHRDDVNNLITLFTFNRWAWVMDPLEAVKKYGSPDETGRLGLYFTTSFRPNSAGQVKDNGEKDIEKIWLSSRQAGKSHTDGTGTGQADGVGVGELSAFTLVVYA